MPGWFALISAVVAAGANAGIAYASQPNIPSAVKSSRRTVLADLSTLPGRRMVEMAARLGIPVDYPTGRVTPKYAQKTLGQALADGDITQQVFEGYLNAKPAAGGRPRYTADSVIKVQTGFKEPETRHADFTGAGDADIQARLARAMARNQLALSAKYGDQFIDEAKRQQALADPEGTAARALLAEEINRIETGRGKAERPVAGLLDTQVLDELRHGRETTPDVDRAVAGVLAGRAASGAGGSVGAGDIQTELAAGQSGDARLAARLQKAMGYLSSGATPEDVSYRRRQQSLANMANFLGGRTPTAQFQQLSGGQQGAAPVARPGSLPGLNPNIQAIGNQAALQQLNLGAAGQAQQANPWFAGLAALTRGANVAGAAGWQPFQRGA